MRKIIYLVLLLWFALACRIGNKIILSEYRKELQKK